MIDEERTPVVVAAGQVTERDELVRPTELMERAAAIAFDAVGDLRPAIGRVSVVNILSRTSPSSAGALAQALGLHPAVTETSAVGGNSPQWLVNRAAAAIRAGTLQGALIAGAEAQHSGRRRRQRAAAGHDPDGITATSTDLPPDTIIGDDRPGFGPAELGAGLMIPVHIYPLFESTLAQKACRPFPAHRLHLARALSRMSSVAQAHPNAWFQKTRSENEIATPSPDNRLVAEPYTKRMCAFLAVDQAAAVVVCSLATARRAGVAERAVFVWSGADCNDVWFPTERPDPGSSPAIAAAGRAALAAAGIDIDDVSAFDLYSCFPCALELAADALGIALDDPRGLTVTGGLPYFGGPGNNYSLHAIATMTDRLRHDDFGVGLVTAMGWFATKHSLGIYGSAPTPIGSSAASATPDLQTAIDATAVTSATTLHDATTATVIASTVVYDDAGAPASAPVIVRLDDGRQAACALDEANAGSLPALAGRNLVGERVTIAGSPPHYRL